MGTSRLRSFAIKEGGRKRARNYRSFTRIHKDVRKRAVKAENEEKGERIGVERVGNRNGSGKGEDPWKRRPGGRFTIASLLR